MEKAKAAGKASRQPKAKVNQWLRPNEGASVPRPKVKPRQNAKLAVRMSNLKKPPASWRCLPRHVLHGSAISPWGVPPRVPLLPQSVVTQPQQNEAQGAVQNNLLLPHQPANNMQTLRLKAQGQAALDVVSISVCDAGCKRNARRHATKIHAMRCWAERDLSSTEQM